MRTQQLMAWLAMATLAVPQSALAAYVPADHAVRITLSDAELESAHGGSIPTTKIGATSQLGYLTVLRDIGGTLSCGTAAAGSSPILPSTINRPQCSASIPLHSLSDTSVAVLIGGMAANLQQNGNPSITVYVNGVLVPASALGADFETHCPQDGTAFSQGADLAIYNCATHPPFNVARVPTSYFHAGLNTITVDYRLLEAAFQRDGSDIDTRIISMN